MVNVKLMEQVEAALAQFAAKDSDETFNDVMEALRKAMNQQGSFIIPIYNYENARFKGIELGNGKTVVMVFTNEAELAKMIEDEYIRFPIEDTFNKVLFEPKVEGILINPLGDNAVIYKEDMKQLFAKNLAEEKALKKNEEYHGELPETALGVFRKYAERVEDNWRDEVCVAVDGKCM